MTSAPAMLALVTDAFGGRGGIAQYNRDFLSALAEAGPGGAAMSSITVLPRHAPDPVVTPSGIKQLPQRPSRMAYILSALSAARSQNFDVVFCGHLYMAPLALPIARLARAKLIVQMHGVDAWPRPSWLRRWGVEAADLVLCVSRYTRDRVLDWAAMVPERVLVLPNTVGEAFSPGDGSALRAAWDLQDKRVLLSVGRMDARERYKGHDRVLTAIRQLVAEGHDVVYVVLGEGDDLPRLEALAAELEVVDRVRFMGAAELETLTQAYRMADLFVMPSTGEGFGIVFLEAMASGTPALGFAVGGARDALADGELGTAVTEPELLSALARALERPKPNGHALAAAVRARFGRERFAVGAHAIFSRLIEAA